MDLQLEGKLAVVAGASAGIGLAAATLLQSEGARLLPVDRDPPPLSGPHVQGDVRDPRTADRAAALAQEHGGADILVYSAGIQRYGDIVDTDEETWDEVMDVNLKGAYRLGRALAPQMRAKGAGAIVYVASVQGFATQAGVAAYSASKGALLALTRSMAVDFAPAIRVNAVCPGSVDTPMLRASAEKFGGGDPDAALRQWAAMHPLKRIAQAEEVANVIAFLASDRASFVTGASYMVDGGLLIRLPGTD